MCGRIVDYLTEVEIKELYPRVGASRLGTEHRPRYNLAPTQTMRTVRLNTGGEQEIASLSWGMYRFVHSLNAVRFVSNSKSKKLNRVPMWKGPLAERRCLIPVNGFYEWMKLPDGSKQPHYIHFTDGSPMTIAGLWDTWHREENDGMECSSVITAEPNVGMAKFHDRMPAILSTRAQQDAWLDPNLSKDDHLELLTTLSDGLLSFRSVGNYVNRVRENRVDDPRCIEAGTVGEKPKPLKFKRSEKMDQITEASQGDLFCS